MNHLLPEEYWQTYVPCGNSRYIISNSGPILEQTLCFSWTVSMTQNSLAISVLLFLVLPKNVSGRCNGCPISLGVDDYPGPGSKTLENKSLKGFNFSTVMVSSLVLCLEACQADCRCASMNYQKPQTNGERVCELNYETKDSRQEALTNDTDYNYYDIYIYNYQVSFIRQTYKAKQVARWSKDRYWMEDIGGIKRSIWLDESYSQ